MPQTLEEIYGVASKAELDAVIAGKKLFKNVGFDDVTFKDASPGVMQMSGYASTSDADLVNDIIKPAAFTKYIHAYRKNPVYCYQHDQGMPIGKIERVDITDKGLYLHNITLSNIPAVRETIWPLIKDGVLRQQSIGFLSLEGAWVEGTDFYEHKTVYMLETSIVTVACNPQAMLDVVKRLPGAESFRSLSELVRAQAEGRVPVLSEISKAFAITNNPLSKDNLEMKETKTADTANIAYDETGDLIGHPRKHSKNYAELCGALYLKSDVESGSHRLPLGAATSRGYRFVWENVAVSMCKTLGARNHVAMNGDERADAMLRLAAAYTRLGKDMPVVDGVPLDEMSSEALANLRVSEVTFAHNEKALLEASILESNFAEIKSLFDGYAKDKTLPEEAMPVWKRMRAFFDVYGSVETAEDMQKVADIMQVVAAQSEQPSAPETPSGAYTVETSAPDPDLSAEVAAALKAVNRKRINKDV